MKKFVPNEYNWFKKELNQEQEYLEEATQKEAKSSEKRERLELNLEELVEEEKTLLGRLTKKARNLARVLILVTALSLTSEIGETKIEEPKKVQSETSPTETIVKKEKPVFYKIEQKEKKVPPEILENLKMVYITVIHNRKPRPLILSKEELRQALALNIDGYIANILIFAKDEMDIKLNRKSAKRIEKYAKEPEIILGGGVIYPKQLKTEKYGEEIFEELLSGKVVKRKNGKSFLKGGYFFGKAVTMVYYDAQPVSNVENNVLTFKKGDEVLKIPIRQKIFQRYKKIDLVPESSRDDLIFYYLGNQLKEFSKIKNLDQKLLKIAEGVNNLESFAGIDFIKKVNLIDYKESGAYTDYTFLDLKIIYIYFPKSITFFSETLEISSPEKLKIIAEHEILHPYVKKKGFTKNQEIREIFADLKGYVGWKKQKILRDGWIPFDAFNKDYQNKIFFAFIDEGNFFRFGFGGHSHRNVDEFLTSFFHTLMYLDKLEENLDLPVFLGGIFEEPEERKLSAEEKLVIIDNYIKVLEVLLKNVKDIPVIGRFQKSREEKFLKDKLREVKNIKQKLRK